MHARMHLSNAFQIFFFSPALQEGRHRWHFLVNFQFVFVPWDTMCPIKWGERGKLLRQSGWPTTGKMKHVCLPPHLNWRCRSQDQGSGSPHCSHCELWCRVNSAGRKMIFFFFPVMVLCKISKFSTLKSPVFHQQLQGSWQGVMGIYLKFICPVLS